MKTINYFLMAFFLCAVLVLGAADVQASNVSVNADLSQCEDPTCIWQLGDSANATGCSSMDHAFSETGTHQVQLTVDCGAFTQKATRTVTVESSVMKTCQDHLDAGHTESGVYEIDPDGEGGVEPFDVYCDQETDGGGWTLMFGGNKIPEKVLTFGDLRGYNSYTYSKNSFTMNQNVSCDGNVYGGKVSSYKNIPHDEIRFKDIKWDGMGDGDSCTNFNMDGYIVNDTKIESNGYSGTFHQTIDSLEMGCGCSLGLNQRGWYDGGTIWVR